MCERIFFSWKAKLCTYLQGKKLLPSKGNGQCFINDLLLHIARMSVVGVDGGVLALSLEPDADYKSWAAKTASCGGLRKQRVKALFGG